MAKKNELQALKDKLKGLHESEQLFTEAVLNSEIDSLNLSDEEITQVKEYLQSLELSDVELDTIINWYESKGPGLDEEDLVDNDLDDDIDLSDEDEEMIDNETSDSFDNIDESEEDFLNDLKANYADNPSVKASDPVKMYLKEIGRVPLLKPDEEKKIAYTIHGDAQILLEIEDIDNDILEKQTRIDEISAKNKKDLSKEESSEITQLKKDISALEKKKTKLYKDNEKYKETPEYELKAQEAKDMLTSANLRLVVAIAKKYVGRGLLFLDLIQEGNMGLVKAVEKFEPSKGFKFSTYATWWIRQAITRAIADQARTIRIPVHMVETINKLTRVQRQLVQELGREPSAEEISEKMEGVLTPEKVREIQKIALDPVSLETPIGEEDDSHLGDFIEDKDALSPDEYATRQLLKDEIDSVLQLLTERERKVLQLRFGLIDGRTRTLEEVGKEFNVTRERIRQIEAKALRKLKHPTKSKRLKDFVDKT